MRSVCTAIPMKTPLIAAFLAATAIAHAQETQAPRKITYTTETVDSRTAEQKKQDEAANERAFYAYPVGQTFWLITKRKTYLAFPFFTQIRKDQWGFKLDNKLDPNVTVSFKVAELLVSPDYAGKDQYAYRVVIEDGTEAYMVASRLGEYKPGRRADDRSGDIGRAPSDARDNGHYDIFAGDPAKLLQAYEAEQRRTVQQEQARLQAEFEAQRKSDAKAASIAKRKGGVTLGMTAVQVRASGWGVPQSVNRTTTAHGVHEQWVYGGHNYLYFENGVLTNIQN